MFFIIFHYIDEISLESGIKLRIDFLPREKTNTKFQYLISIPPSRPNICCFDENKTTLTIFFHILKAMMKIINNLTNFLSFSIKIFNANFWYHFPYILTYFEVVCDRKRKNQFRPKPNIRPHWPKLSAEYSAEISAQKYSTFRNNFQK